MTIHLSKPSEQSKLSDLVDRLRGWVFRRRYNAMRVYNLLRTYRAHHQLEYDEHTATVTATRPAYFLGGEYRVRLTFARRSVRISSSTRLGHGTCTLVTAASPQLGEAIAAIVVGLLTTGVGPYQPLSTIDETDLPISESGLSTMDAGAPHCCSWPMVETDPEVWFPPNEPVQVERVYRCTECDWVTRVEVTDRDAADRLSQQFMAGGDQ